MENEKNMRQDRKPEKTVSYLAYSDLDFAYQKAMDSRWHLVTVVLAIIIFFQFIIAMLVIYKNNQQWLETWNQYDLSTETVTTTVDSEGDGIANYSGGDGGVATYGESNSPKDNQNEAVRLDGNETSNQNAEEVTDEPGN